ncbi:RbsD/FucU family protein [Sinomonas sp. RB5]
MINYTLLHPDLLAVLARAGHGSRILIADANYPHSTGAPPTAARIALNLRPGLLTVDQILEVLLDAVPIEAALTMATADGTESPAVQGYREQLGPDVAFSACGRFDFYAAAREPDVAAVIASADMRQYANLLLTLGVRTTA